MNALRRSFIAIVCVLIFAGLVRRAAAQQYDEKLYSEMRWRNIGPFRGGRTVAVTGVPGQPNVFYMAAVNGGVWKTTDYGETWKPIFDGQPSGSVGALAVAPSDPNIIYAGSGEGIQRPDLAVGDGIYKSTDAGATWTHLGLRDAEQINSIIVDPHDANRLFVAALGHPYGANAERGVYRSTDGGRTFDKVLYKDENTGAEQVAFDPRDPQTIYADLWAARRPPWTTGNSINGLGSGLYKSTDGGSTWHQLTGGLPTDEQGLGRIGIGIAPSDPNRIYALLDAPRLGGFFRSDDAGANWTRVNTENRIWGRGADFAGVTVDPRNEDEIYVANTSTYRSTDAGKSFTAIKGAPGGDDYHTIWINPDDPQIILLGLDQGATISVNGGQTWSSWYNQSTAQMYHVATDNRFPYWVCSGQQESGSACVASRGDYGEITFGDWHPVGAEEYGYVAPDPLNPDVVFGGKVSKFHHSTRETQDVSPAPFRGGGNYRYNRTAPLIFSYLDPHTLYLGSNVLFKTADGGQSWQIISPDLTREKPGVPASLGVFSGREPGEDSHRGVIYSIAPSHKDVNQIWIGTDDGLIQMTRDGGKTWANVTPPELTPWSKVAQMDASHSDAEEAYAAVNRFRLDDLHPYIYRTRDGGKTWKQITNGLPENASVNTVREDPKLRGLLFCGTETSIYVSFDDGDHWQSLQLNLPATSMRDLVIHDDDVVVGTHGRGFWILDDVTPLRQIDEKTAAAATYLFAPEVAYRVHRDRNTDTPLPPEFPAGKNPPDGAILDYVLQNAASSPVTLEIYDGMKKLVRRYSSADKPEPIDPELNVPTYWVRPARILSAEAGMHRFVWDLRGAPPDSLSHGYPISAVAHDTPRLPLGAWVLPGTYTVKLTVDGKSYTQPLKVNMDPRTKAAPGGLLAQHNAEITAVSGMNRSFAALDEAQQLRTQLRILASRAEQGSALAAAIAALDQKAVSVAGAGGFGGRGGRGGGGGGETFARLNGEFGQMLETFDSADLAPTTQASAALAELQLGLTAKLVEWSNIKATDIPALNKLLAGAGLPEIVLRAAARMDLPGPAVESEQPL